jgi:hypothetical protein
MSGVGASLNFFPNGNGRFLPPRPLVARSARDRRHIYPSPLPARSREANAERIDRQLDSSLVNLEQRARPALAQSQLRINRHRQAPPPPPPLSLSSSSHTVARRGHGEVRILVPSKGPFLIHRRLRIVLLVPLTPFPSPPRMRCPMPEERRRCASHAHELKAALSAG